MKSWIFFDNIVIIFIININITIIRVFGIEINILFPNVFSRFRLEYSVFVRDFLYLFMSG